MSAVYCELLKGVRFIPAESSKEERSVVLPREEVEVMCVMVLSSASKLPSILQKLNNLDVSHLYFFNTEAPHGFGVPLLSLVPFANLLVCEDGVLDDRSLRNGMLLSEAKRMEIPVVSETALSETLRS